MILEEHRQAFNNQYFIRELRENDDHESFIRLLGELSSNAPYMKKEEFLNVFNKRKNNNIYTFVTANKYTNEIIGTISALVEPKFIHGGQVTVHIEDFVVSKSYRGKRIGSIMLDAMKNIIETMTNKQIYNMILHTSNENAEFYKKSGYREKGIALEKN